MIYKDRFQRDRVLKDYEELFKDPVFQKAFGSQRESEIFPVIEFLKSQGDLSEATILDIGAGYGALSIPLAKESRKVISCDILDYSLKAIQYRAMGNNIDNIDTIRIDAFNSPFLPFKGETFDMVVLNGVLEYAGYTRSANPEDIQLTILGEVNRLLKPSGIFYLAIENRFAINYIFGGRGHDGLFFSSLLPKSLANIYSKLMTGNQYRMYELSYPALKSALQVTGFKNVTFHCGIRSYNRPRHIVSIEDRRLLLKYGEKYIRRKLSRLGLRFILALRLQKFIWPHFIVVSHK